MSNAPRASPVTMDGDGDDFSALREAVTALKSGTNIYPEYHQRPTSLRIKGPHPDDTDSGYDSNNASQTSTPESTPQKCNKSIYIQGLLVERPLGFRPKKIKLQLFEGAIPQPTSDRFINLKAQYTDALFNYIRAPPNPRKIRSIAMTLELLGESKETAVPWVVVQCHKSVAKKVWGFFKQAHIEGDYKPIQPTTHAPYLRILVLEEEPDKLARLDSLLDLGTSFDNSEVAGMKVYSRSSTLLETLCGTEIQAINLGAISSATVGGFVTIYYADNRAKVYALTAGHFLDLREDEEEDDDWYQYNYEGDDHDEDDEDVINGFPFGEHDSYEINLPLKTMSIETGSFFDGNNTSARSAVSETGREIGHVFKASQDDLQDQQNLDWALIEISDHSLYLPNVVNSSQVFPTIPSPIDGLGRKVILTTPTGGSLTGSLSETWSYLALSPGNRMVATFLLTLSDNQVFRHGDSGAWVFDANTKAVYGHVVASDAFGRAYIVPMKDIIDEITTRTSSKSVELSKNWQISTFKTKTPPYDFLFPEDFHDHSDYTLEGSLSLEPDFEIWGVSKQFNTPNVGQAEEIVINAQTHSADEFDLATPGESIEDMMSNGVAEDITSRSGHDTNQYSVYEGGDLNSGANDSAYASMNVSPSPSKQRTLRTSGSFPLGKSKRHRR